MALTSGILAIRVVIIFLTVGGCSNTILAYDSAIYEIDQFNAYISLAVLASYAFSIMAKSRLVGIYARAGLFMLLSLVWFSFNLSWICNRYLNRRQSSRLDVTVALPVSILIIIESIMTLKWEVRRKRREEVIRSCRDREMLVPAGQQQQQQQQQGRFGGASFWPSRPLPQDEEDNIEVIIPANLQYPPPSRIVGGTDSSVTSASIAGSNDGDAYDNTRDSDEGSVRSTDKSTMYQRPEQAYFQTGASNPSVSPSPSSSSAPTSSGHATSLSMNQSNDDQLPPYTRD
ncbi:hypothetical protein BGZ46_008398 [Entomortierella lignicola]|nr:hypothetical protein BGZ46_008398 [Entomortierella lignicola]